jgi:hypothetical protein
MIAIATTVGAVLAQSDGYEFNIGYVVVSILIGGAIGAAIGSTKNRILLGTLLGAFLGCIGWIITAVLPKKNPY